MAFSRTHLFEKVFYDHFFNISCFFFLTFLFNAEVSEREREIWLQAAIEWENVKCFMGTL